MMYHFNYLFCPLTILCFMHAEETHSYMSEVRNKEEEDF
jgi:hypothetical protein